PPPRLPPPLGSLPPVPQRPWPAALKAPPPLVEGLLGPGRAAIVQQRVRILACRVVVKAVRSRPGGQVPSGLAAGIIAPVPEPARSTRSTAAIRGRVDFGH